jgi:hypothetical protein
MPECGPHAGALRQCPRQRVVSLTATEHDLRAAAAEAAKYPDADVSLPAVVLLRLLDDRHIVGKKLAGAEARISDARRSQDAALAARESWMKTALDAEAQANRATDRLMAIIQKCHEANHHFADCLVKNRRISRRVYEAWRADLRRLGDEEQATKEGEP